MKTQEALAALAAACVALGATATLSAPTPSDQRSDPCGSLVVNGVGVTSDVDVRAVRKFQPAFSRRAPEVLRYQVTVRSGYGRLSDKTTVPCNRGVYDWAVGARALIRIAERRVAEQEREATRDGHAEAVAALAAELGIDHWGKLRIEPSSDPDLPARLKVEFSETATLARVREVHAALVALGVLTA